MAKATLQVGHTSAMIRSVINETFCITAEEGEMNEPILADMLLD